MGGHDFLEHMSFRMAYIMIAYVYKVVMLCCRKSLMGGNVLVECMSSGWHILQMLCFTERCVLLEVMFCLRVCIIGEHVLLFEMSYWSTCFTGGHILLDDLLYKGIPLICGQIQVVDMSYRKKPYIT